MDSNFTLLPCPFCGNVPFFSSVEARDDGRYMAMDLVCCVTMTASIGYGRFRNMTPAEIKDDLTHQLVEQWNRRHTEECLSPTDVQSQQAYTALEKERNLLLEVESNLADMHIVALEENETLQQKLAVCQLREQQLREALLTIRRYWNDDEQESHDRCNRAAEVLTLPQDTSALEAMCKRAGEVMREWCCELIAEIERQLRGHGAATAAENANAIGALPAVTLKDLK